MNWWTNRHNRSGTADAEPSARELRDERLSAYLDGDLAADERSVLEAELASDAELRDELEGMRQVRTLLATLEIVPAPRSFALAAPPPRAVPALFSRLEMATRVAAGVAAVAFMVAVLGPETGGPTVQDEAAQQPQAMSAESAAPAEEPEAELRAAAPALGTPAAADEDAEALQAPQDADIAGGVGGGMDDGGEPGSGGAEAEARGPAPAPAPATGDRFAGEPFAGPPPPASEAAGDPVPALGVLALLLAALAGLMAWERREQPGR